MNHLTRKIAISAVAGAALLSLAACGSSSNGVPAASPTTGVASPSASSTSSSEVTNSSTTEIVIPHTAPSADKMVGAEEITVAPGGYFLVTIPKGLDEAAKASNNDATKVNLQEEFDPALVSAVTAGEGPKKLAQGEVVVPESAKTGASSSLWQVAKDATGTANILISYTDPSSGGIVKSALVVHIK